MIEVKRPSEKPLKNQNYFADKMVKVAAEKRESDTKWYKDNPGKTPGWNDNHTWKTFSQQRRPSEVYREGYDSIDWGNG